ncbi:MAG: hypothetical protein OXC08_16360 [Thiotrichales bacterium]|nr:hypothetical protein [Thiotrichales bacterium]
MRLVKYIGRKSVHIDSLYRTGTVWNGHGDIAEIRNDRAAQSMCDAHPDVYELVEHDSGLPRVLPPDVTDENVRSLYEKTVELPNGTRTVLLDAPRPALVDYARDELGLEIRDGHTRDDILRFIAEYEEVLEANRQAAAQHQRVDAGATAQTGAHDEAGVRASDGTEAPDNGGAVRDDSGPEVLRSDTGPASGTSGAETADPVDETTDRAPAATDPAPPAPPGGGLADVGAGNLPPVPDALAGLDTAFDA